MLENEDLEVFCEITATDEPSQCVFYREYVQSGVDLEAVVTAGVQRYMYNAILYMIRHQADI